MKTITNLIFIALLFVTASLSAQEHGPVLGGSLGTLHEKVSMVSSNFEGYKLHYHIGYAYRQYWGNRKFAMDGIALFGSQGTDYQAFNSDSPKYSVNGKYLSIGTVFSYECFSNFRLGVGADVAWYVNRLGASTYNSKKNAIDIPIVARVSYTLKWLELQLSYKQGTCNLMNTSGVGKVASRNIQFSVFMPIFK